ncbi:hypothetical protein L208DRAFT_1457749 [Tricholoma matsutake]|nr:hypothetical protein L208DRAFT_1457749 [Tricholoma matsutake 945]
MMVAATTFHSSSHILLLLQGWVNVQVHQGVEHEEAQLGLGFTGPQAKTTNHFDCLYPALSHPGHMVIWVELKNASKWRSKAIFHNFFPSADNNIVDMVLALILCDILLINSTLLSFSLLASICKYAIAIHLAWDYNINDCDTTAAVWGIEPGILAPTSTLNKLAKKFAESVLEEFSVAALQGYLLKNKSKPEEAANSVDLWVVNEREMRERLKQEKDEKEEKEKIEV